MPLAFTVAGLAVVVLVALLAVGRLGALPAERPDVAPLNLPEDRALSAADVTGVRFAVGLRGYRMDQVDVVLERVAVEVREKDARIAALQHELAGVSGAPQARAALPPADPASVHPVPADPVPADPQPADPMGTGPAPPAGNDGAGTAR